ncbi:MAG: hypothetical protein RL265_229 [Bacteroidota bacterium]
MPKKNVQMSKRSELTKNILKLITGTAIAQLISILISPALTRIYTSEEFGEFTLVSSIFAMLALIAGGRYELAILLPKRKTEAANVFVLSLLVNCLFLVVLIASFTVIDYFWIDQNFGIWYYVIPFFVFLLGIIQSVNAWFNRRKMYHAIAVNKIVSAASTNGLSLLNGLLKVTFNGLLLATLIAGFVNILLLFYQIRKDWNYIRRSISFSRMKEFGKKYKRFPLINSFQSIMDASQINGLIYLISALFGKQIVGIFALAIRILIAPMNFIGGSISQVFYQEANDLHNSSKGIIPLMKKTIVQTSLLMAFVLVVILLFGPFLFGMIFGEEWTPAGVYAQIICPWICLDFIRAPLSQIPIILNKQKEMLYLSIVNNILTLILLVVVGIYFKDLTILLFVITITQVVYITIVLLWIFRIALKNDLSLKLGHLIKE